MACRLCAPRQEEEERQCLEWVRCLPGRVGAKADLKGRRPWRRGAGVVSLVQRQKYMQHKCGLLGVGGKGAEACT